MARRSFHDQINNLPCFEELPKLPNLPKGCTWGLWDKGSRDELGTLNLLTPDTVKNAGTEIRAGISVSLNWSLDKPKIPVFGRKKLSHKIIDNSTFSGSASFDDELSFNTQSGSQWDGLRHAVYRDQTLLYNRVTKQEIMGPDSTDVLGLNKWHDKGGIVGRGVLIDYVAYAERHRIEYSATECHAISHADLDAAAEAQGLTFKQGDILLVRSGLTKWFNEASDEDRDSYFTNPMKAAVGIAPTPETVSWVWDHHFSAVAGDTLAWEHVPYSTNTLSFHTYLLAFWGTPIGELWDLENLAEICHKLGRYSFFLSSVPLNVPGGVASPPNAVAVF
ncbi:hypothetical protein LARI1_G007478 [Lachnellula arida]|uniref:Cyclase n=1 Tax=Lachnellula arida TaxID=1316785 RepID=A0A8T9B4A6_9HELO|nr:hypothetical protein LARI1_G007478 [Lachnellula arida]